MATLALEFPHEEKWATHNPSLSRIGMDGEDSLWVRETPQYKVRERWTTIKLKREELMLHYSLTAHDEVAPISMLPERTGFARLIERFGIWVCREFHRAPYYQPGSLYSKCGCGRKYAVPWFKSSHPTIVPYFPAILDADVYVNDEPVIKPTEQTRQAPIRHGTQGVF